MTTQLVWLKRDLRIHDHAPMARAAERGPVHMVYVYEPSLWRSEEMDGSHLRFIGECLIELRDALRVRGATLVTRIGELPECFERIHRESAFEAIWSHEETGNALSFERDKRVARWCRERGIAFHEIPQHGVFRPHPKRDGWAKRWRKRMDEALTPPVERFTDGPELESAGIVDELGLGIAPSTKKDVQRGGSGRAHEVLESFLDHRGVNYRADMSSPVAGWSGCSRLSPHFAWGSISIREVYQRTRERERELKALKSEGAQLDPRWLPSVSSFFKRLSWHCHFIQKLEDEPAIEFQNMSRVYDGMRENDFDSQRFDAWAEGRTGYPMVDACMRCVKQTSWLNFRMRAMVVSFASYHLWLHWRPTALFLARHFLDFEPGIHFSQFQMQSGVTGINTVRVYSPAKQAKDQDPEGVFIRRWVPELEGVPLKYLPEPHTMPPLLQRSSGCRIGVDYPAPVVDHKTAYREARERIFAVRRRDEAREEAQRVYQKHGSRKRPQRGRQRKSTAAVTSKSR
ncbi:MAG: deoxyribodipyrimidine photo-lyase [Myxococcota bacterium]